MMKGYFPPPNRFYSFLLKTLIIISKNNLFLLRVFKRKTISKKSGGILNIIKVLSVVGEKNTKLSVNFTLKVLKFLIKTLSKTLSKFLKVSNIFVTYMIAYYKLLYTYNPNILTVS